MKLRTILSALLVLVTSAVMAQLENGKVYRLKNAVYESYAQENATSHLVTCSAMSEKEKYAQMWIAEGSNGKFSLQNVYTARYIVPKASMSEVYNTSETDAYKFSITQNAAYPEYYNVLYNLYSEWYMSCAYGGNVLSWYEAASAGGSPTISEWKFEEVDITQAEIEQARADYATTSKFVDDAKRYYAEFKKLFEDEACTELKTAYKAMTDEQLLQAMEGFPQAFKEIAFKIKNDTWEEYEEEFRVADYKPYSDAYNWGISLKANPYSPLTAPTGITCEKNDILLVFVDKQISYPSMLYLEEIKGNEVFSSGSTELKQGLNVITAMAGGTIFINYKVETDRGAESRKLADYPNVKIHIEGGVLNGYFDKSRHTNEDWVKMQKNLFKHEIINVKGEHAMFHMHRNKVIPICPDNIYESINWWDTIVQWEKELMGATQYADRWNNPMLCVDGEGQYMFATYYYTYYEYSTLQDILPWKKVYNNPGYAWGPAHEIGHMNQGAINVVSGTEVSNNLFANMVVHRIGKTTTRGLGMDVCYRDWENKVPYPLRGEVFSKTRMYWQLYLYFHAAGHDTTFYPRLFEYLRETPLSTTSGVNGKFNQLRFAEACCEIAQMDLSEFFEVWGFFEPMNNAHVGDYQDYYVTLSAEDAEASRAKMQQYKKKGGHLIFIEDRVKPSKRTDGVDGYRLDYESSVPVGSVGSTGQWEDYIDTTVKAEGYYYKSEGNYISIVEEPGAKGAVGFKLYDAESGELLAVNNNPSLKIPVKAKASKLRIVAAQADGTDSEIPNIAESDNEEMQIEVLYAALTTAEGIMGKTTTTGREIGYFFADALTTLSELYDAAKAAADDQNTSVHTYREWANLLNKEIERVKSDLNARAYFKELDVYRIISVSDKSRQLCYDENGLKADKQNQTAISSDKKKWMVESTGEFHHYYIKNKNGQYINGYQKNVSTSCSGNEQSSAVVIKANYTDNGRLYFTTNEGNEVLYLTLNSDNNVVFGTDLVDAALWTVVRLEANNTGIEEVKNESGEVKTIYDLTGRRIEKITTPGIYIIDGKKVVVE